MEKATFAAGCFWGVEQIFMETKGVVNTRVGYSGGHLSDPTYKDVCSGETGHAEAVEIVFDTSIISYEKLLDVFWANHNSTTLNRQGPDIGHQYRSVIFYHDKEQKEKAEISRRKEERRIGKKIVSEIVPAGRFYEAEAYHQKYLQKRGLAACHI